jgi:hypothetical protein
MGESPVRLLLATLRWPHGEGARLAEEWARAPTQGLEGLIDHEECALWLSRRLAAIGAMPAPGFAQWLTRKAREATARNLLIDAQLDALLSALDAASVPHVLLKGAARRQLIERFPYADARGVRDVDVLLPSDRAQETWDLLRAAGYERVLPPGVNFPITHHLPALWNAARVSVELHVQSSLVVGPAECWRRATTGALAVRRNGIATRVPNATELLWHALTHAFDNDIDGFRLRYWLDAAVILAGTDSIDWDVVRQRLDAGEIKDRRAARAWLGAAAELAGRHIPAATNGMPPFDIEGILRWRLAVLSRFPLGGRVTEKLLHEGIRGALRWPLTPAVAGTGAYRGARRRLSAAGARAVWLVWRALQ